VLAGQGRATAVGAAAAVGLERTQPTSQEDPLELLNVCRGNGH
jgi:hypothetical protein